MSAQDRFREADALFQAGRFEDALCLLKELDQLYPGDRHLLYPMALCLAKLGCWQDGLRVCERLEAEFGYAKAAELAQKLRKLLTPPPLPESENKTAHTKEPATPMEKPAGDALLSPPDFDGEEEPAGTDNTATNAWAYTLETAPPRNKRGEAPSMEMFEEEEMPAMEEREGGLGLLR